MERLVSIGLPDEMFWDMVGELEELVWRELYHHVTSDARIQDYDMYCHSPDAEEGLVKSVSKWLVSRMHDVDDEDWGGINVEHETDESMQLIEPGEILYYSPGIGLVFDLLDVAEDVRMGEGDDISYEEIDEWVSDCIAGEVYLEVSVETAVRYSEPMNADIRYSDLTKVDESACDGSEQPETVCLWCGEVIEDGEDRIQADVLCYPWSGQKVILGTIGSYHCKCF